MPDARLTIDPSMVHHFRLDHWDALDDGGRLALGDYLAERLQASGRDVPEPMALQPFGPPDSPRSVLQWREPGSGMTFSFIPGGTFRPGFDETQLALLEEWRRQEGSDDDEEETENLEPGQTLVFGSESPCDLRLKPPVEIRPFFLATEMVRPSLPGLRSVVKLDDIFFQEKQPGDFDFMGDAIHFSWEQVEPVLKPYGWSLPTSTEFEWALRGGHDSLFYWGDHLPTFLMEWGHPEIRGSEGTFDDFMSASFAAERPRVWPWCNRFGLAAMLPLLTWCARSTVPDDPTPLVVRGGAAYCYPWQGCGEWELLLNTVESRFEEVAECTIRPTIRLEVGA